MTTETVFRSADIPASDRFAYWSALMSDTVCPMDLRCPTAGDFRAEMRVIPLGSAVVWSTQLPPVHMVRTDRMIRRSDPGLYHLSLPLSGRVDVEQMSYRSVHYRRQLYVVDTDRPFVCRTTGSEMRGIGLEIPKQLVPLPTGRVERLLARQLSGREGIGAYLADFLTRIARDVPRPGTAEASRLDAILLDLFIATLAHGMEAEDELPPHARRSALALSVKAFIRENLGDPQLTASAVAASHHISSSYLHGLFRSEETTVSAWIRRLRLERARRDLTDPSQATVPIGHIAARWGFAHYAVFSRAFRTEYGISPRECRYEALAEIATGATGATGSVDS
ncbi:AraC family transcriptional regulator [Streptomyces paludis]|uniref:AraC family transcriptional regulator n=1 Tax=Streptomyces paludis TaxID=2282738 RepID=A0A345HRH1_9ACTN|nr:AraC family transcriptional regulator [Streptomyces paludis]AXG79295.1 AraC family transcriptional regulator [Streptomyces paludis]